MLFGNQKGHMGRYSHGDVSKPEVVRGHITATGVRAIDNAHVCEVVDVNGELHTQVETIVPCGGGFETFSIMPRQIGQEVFLLKTSVADQPYIIGSVFKASDVAVSNDIYPTPRVQDRHIPTTTDYVVSNKGNTINLSNGYGIQMTTSSDMRIQLPSDGMLRISAGGRSGDCALDGARYINESHKIIEELRAKEQLLETQLDLVRGYVVSLNQTLLTLTTAMAGEVALQGVAPVTAAAALTASNAMTANKTNIDPQSITNRNDINTQPLRTIQAAKQDTLKAVNHKVRLPR